MKKILKLFPSDEKFIELFASEKTRLAKILGPVVQIEHVGSTAVPGLGGKGIIDIAVGVEKNSDIQLTANVLAQNGYSVDNSKKRPGDRVLLLSHEHNGTFNRYGLLVIVKGGEEWRQFLLFRDHLRASKKLRDEYMSLKERSFIKSGADREIYKKLKNDFIQDVLKECK